MIALDHIALAANDLQAGIDHVRTQTGISVPLGGKHTGMGTHNALTATGSESYLEIIAPDPDQAAHTAPRAFAIDETNLNNGPRIQTFLLRTDDIERDLIIARAHGFDLGEALSMSRGDLQWKIALRTDRTLAANGAFPVLLQWPSGPHASERMDNQGLILIHIDITSPEAENIQRTLSQMGFDDHRVRYMNGEKTHITVTYRTPTGQMVTLGAPVTDI